MACTAAQSMLSASSCSCSCAFLRRPQRLGVGGGSGRVSMVSCNASSSPPPPPPPASSPDESDCNTEECAPEKEVGNLSVDWLAGERTKVVGTFPPKKKGWTGYVEKDTAGQTNIYSVEPAVYVAESAISSGAAGTSAEGSENTVAVTAGIALFSIAAASAVLLQVGRNQPQVQGPDYSGPPLSYYITKFKPPQQTVEASVAAPALQSSPSVEASAPTETSGLSSTVEASVPPGVQQLSSSAQVEAGVAAPALQSSPSVEASAPTETSGLSSTVEASVPPGVQQLSSSAQVEAGGSGGAADTEVQVGMLQEQAELPGVSTANAS